MIKRYETKPCEIEAVVWTGKNIIELYEWGDGDISWDNNGDLYIETLEGRMKANLGDFIIKGLRGEFYPCKPDVFHKKYKEIR